MRSGCGSCGTAAGGGELLGGDPGVDGGAAVDDAAAELERFGAGAGVAPVPEGADGDAGFV